MDGPVISLQPDTSERYPDQSYVRPTAGEFQGRPAVKGKIGDLNGDGIEDIRLNFVRAAGNWGESFFVVYAGCGQERFVRVWEGGYAFELEIGKESSSFNQWKTLHQFSREGDEQIYGFSSGSYTQVGDD